jgi:hypothetical protein
MKECFAHSLYCARNMSVADENNVHSGKEALTTRLIVQGSLLRKTEINHLFVLLPTCSLMTGMTCLFWIIVNNVVDIWLKTL